MKNLSTVLNVILLLLVITLFVMFFSLKKTISKGNNSDGYTSHKEGGLRIAYVNADSINTNYLLMKDLKNEVQAKQGELQNVYESKAKKLQDEYTAYQVKAQKGDISQLDAENAQKDMQQKKNELDELQQQQQDFMKNIQDRNFELQKKIQRFIAAYNKKSHFDYVLGYDNVGGSVLVANDSLDITKPIIEGLNAEYKDSVQKAASMPKH